MDRALEYSGVRNKHTAIPRDTLPLDTLTPQIRHYELWQKNSRYANFNELSTPSYAIFDSAHEEVIAFCNVCENLATHHCKTCNHNLCKFCIIDYNKNQRS